MEFGKIENVVEAKFRIVTPMFLGGANHEADEIRPSSVKGMLRFWWRALNWSKWRMHKDCKDDASALRKLHDEEARLFGSAANDNKGGQGVFLLSVKDQRVAPFAWNRPEPQVGYLLGMGLYHFNNGVTRSSIQGEFSIALRFRDTTTQPDRTSVLEALHILGLLGGLGSRQRRGLGSLSMVHIVGVKEFPFPENALAYTAQLQSLFAKGSSASPPFTSFSVMSRAAFLSRPQAMETLKAMGDELGMYRGWGRNGMVFGRPREGNGKSRFKSDHDNMFEAANGREFPNSAPKRLVFGMPHNYRFSSGGNVMIQNTALKLQRRASPLFIHIHQPSPEVPALGVMLMLPAQFLPVNDQVEIRGRVSKKVNPNVDWNDINELLQRPAFNQGAKA